MTLLPRIGSIVAEQIVREYYDPKIKWKKTYWGDSYGEHPTGVLGQKQPHLCEYLRHESLADKIFIIPSCLVFAMLDRESHGALPVICEDTLQNLKEDIVVNELGVLESSILRITVDNPRILGGIIPVFMHLGHTEYRLVHHILRGGLFTYEAFWRESLK